MSKRRCVEGCWSMERAAGDSGGVPIPGGTQRTRGCGTGGRGLGQGAEGLPSDSTKRAGPPEDRHGPAQSSAFGSRPSSAQIGAGNDGWAAAEQTQIRVNQPRRDSPCHRAVKKAHVTGGRVGAACFARHAEHSFCCRHRRSWSPVPVWTPRFEEDVGQKEGVRGEQRARVKRPSGMSSLLGKIGSKKQKMSTLEKSKLDWENFKEEEGIVEELAIHNRGKDGLKLGGAFFSFCSSNDVLRLRLRAVLLRKDVCEPGAAGKGR
ncbi:craniofacial development protein 1 isoform X4 [Anser cygnoides]|uniref:craniofacial development protein 1 isoform X4 n=1 Tax=Anser cygnoides TaxID=8845 RepID=UPI002009ABC1|nr:craniofacial development protein 1 isoform X2 [Anser cygnoides]